MILIKYILYFTLITSVLSCDSNKKKADGNSILVSFFERKIDEKQIRDPTRLFLGKGYEYEILNNEKYNTINIYHYWTADYCNMEGLGNYRISNDTLFLIRDTNSAFFDPKKYSLKNENFSNLSFLLTQYKFSKDVDFDKYYIYIIYSTIEPHEPEFIREKFF